MILLGCVPLCAQNEPSSLRPSDPSAQPIQASQTSSEPNKKTPVDQAPPLDSGNSTQLEPIKKVKASYPFDALKQQLQGQVLVRILISETGDVEKAEVISGNPVLADSAVNAVKQWKFTPVLKNGKPIKVSTTQTFNFAFSENVRQQKAPPETSNTAANPSAAPEGGVPKRVRVSSGVTTGLLVYRVTPVYPVEARREHIQGIVVLQAMISKEGKIEDLKLISGPRELAEAAIDAVQQWRYRPYLLMGEPVAVDTQIQVKFELR